MYSEGQGMENFLTWQLSLFNTSDWNEGKTAFNQIMILHKT